VDWCVDTRTPGAVARAELELAAHLARHALDPTLVELARTTVHHFLDELPAGAVWLNLDWEDPTPLLSARSLPDLPPGTTLLGALVAPGLTAAEREAAQLIGGQQATVFAARRLEVVRGPEGDLDPGPADPAAIPAGFPAAVAILFGTGTARGWDLECTAARAGSTVAARAASPEPPAHLGQVAAAFIAAERELGGEFDVVSLGEDRLVLGCRRCPFGTAPPPAMCRFTSALAGGLAARAGGLADVVIDERIALGDSQCRVAVDLGARSGRPTAHHYQWPPAGVPSEPVVDEGSPVGEKGFEVSVSLQLPRERLSVPVTRHLTRAALDEVGVLEEDAELVELALAEACGNVVEHSGPGDCYEVSMTVSAALAEIRVVDEGRGFDHRSLGGEMADPDAARGRGIALMHALVDQVLFESRPEVGTIVHLVKFLRFDESVPARRLMLEN
jgi:anti-sigma regulatory factor (Ser/Thr protein kinase)